jgi:predicted O-linked N-acetylglucosamine transferase (SPINDLY family)
VVAFDTNTVKQGLISRGISEKRIMTSGRLSGSAYYEMHHEVDVALDTFPFNGLTVSCFAAWMGVPTLSFAARRSASRVGYALASRLGLDSELVSASQEDLKTKAASLVGSLDKLSKIRQSMRSRMSGAVSNVSDWTREFENRITQLLRDWRQKKAPR